jgi:hypothetical protein
VYTDGRTESCPFLTQNPDARTCKLDPPDLVKYDRFICNDHTCADDSGADEGPAAGEANTQQRIAVGRQQAEAPKPAVVAAAPLPETEVVEVVEEVVEEEPPPPTLVTKILTVTQIVTIETTDWVTATPAAGLRRRDGGHQHRRRHVHGD